IALAERGAAGEVYNVASGIGTSVGELARRVLARAGLQAAVESDPALVRAADVPALVGDATKLRTATGWVPRRSLDDLLDDLITQHGSQHGSHRASRHTSHHNSPHSSHHDASSH